jgi:hypothetical protein
MLPLGFAFVLRYTKLFVGCRDDIFREDFAMASERADIWVQPPVQVQRLDELTHNPSPDQVQEKVASDDLLLFGMMLWMEQGLVVEWLQPGHQRHEEEEKENADNLERKTKD